MLTLKGNTQEDSVKVNLEKVVATYCQQEKFTGTVLVAKKGNLLLHKGYGFRDATKKIPNTIHSIYQVASIAKQFTAAVVLSLQEKGKLSVDDKLSKYYPNYPNGDKISIKHLLSHSSGIFNYTENKAFMAGDQSAPVSLADMIALFKDVPLTFEPGTRFRYSNSGYTLLGYIIERITGKSYQETLEATLLQPLKLAHSGYDYGALTDTNKSIGYQQYSSESYDPAIKVHSSILYTTGALYSTTSDLYHWHKQLIKNSFLNASSTESMYTPYAGPYGFGWQIDSLFGRKRVSHSGSVAGFKSNISRIPDDDVCIIVLSNSSSSQVGQLTMTLLSILYNKPYELPIERKSIRLNVNTLIQYTGTYVISPQLSMAIFIEADKIFIQPTNQSKMELLAEKEQLFFLKDFDMQVEFIKNEQSGQFDSLKIIRNKQLTIGIKQ